MNNNRVIGSIILEGAVTAEDSVIINDGGNQKRVQAQACLQDLDVVHRNRRIYSLADM